MKHVKTYLTVSIITTIAIQIAYTYALGSINPMEWTEGQRTGQMLLLAIVYLLNMGITAMISDLKEEK